jgi:formate hydrogenlyase transcriptional activator
MNPAIRAEHQTPELAVSLRKDYANVKEHHRGAEMPNDQLLEPRATAAGQPSEWVGTFASRYEAFLRVSRAINSYREPAALFRALAQELQHVVKFDFLGLVLYDEARNEILMPVLEVVNGSGVVVPPELRPEETIAWWVYKNQKPVVISCTGKESRFAAMMEVYKRYGVQSAVVLPLSTARRRLGGLALGSEQPSAYADDEVRYLELVADQIALAVDNALRDE